MKYDHLNNEKHCPRCGSDRLTIDNIDGFVCDKCGCWWDADDKDVIWAMNHKPEGLVRVD